MSVSIVPHAPSHAAGFHACLDAVAQIEAPPLDRIEDFVRDSIAADAAQFVALDDPRVVGWCDIFPDWAHAVRHCGSGLAPSTPPRPASVRRHATGSTS